ncbi:unnamed protein product [Taenia asiatica]|uniref:Uncharacterized protein n=1 Tax=Taenia asiatica TaxID=60517 RepID=A0A0R3W061_TAEAS|nr:unnamed protein product [Taenia asiatica]
MASGALRDCFVTAEKRQHDIINLRCITAQVGAPCHSRLLSCSNQAVLHG